MEPLHVPQIQLFGGLDLDGLDVVFGFIGAGGANGRGWLLGRRDECLADASDWQRGGFGEEDDVLLGEGRRTLMYFR